MMWTIRNDPYYGHTVEATIGEYITITRVKGPRYFCTYNKGGLRHSSICDNWSHVERWLKGYNEDPMQKPGA